MIKKIIIVAVVISAVTGVYYLSRTLNDDLVADIKGYEYLSTKRLVAFVTQAARQIEKQGEAVFPEFRDRKGKWVQGDLYIFIYDAKGTAIVHPYEPELEGQCLIDLLDFYDRPVIKGLIDTASHPPDYRGWVHYSWVRPGDIFPMWKSTYVIRVKAPSGKEYFVGSGLYNMKMERRFIIDMVDSAAKEIETDGKAAFEKFRGRSSEFNILDSYVFVTDIHGVAVVDPGFPTKEGRDLQHLKDMDGKEIIAEVLERTRNADTAWFSYKWPKPGTNKMAKKIMYVRKVRIGSEEFLVGADYYASKPLWMK